TAITELKPDYEPWFSPLYEPPSGEVESALFALQAALGAGVLAYYFGLRRGRRQGEQRALEREAGTALTDAAGKSAAERD
ncbi:energy-coupling factor ABC transporter substrate-binding protein, partial [Streptomyces alfalfae]|uniref:energy-coupling factor ABC transporter substrate-binding protein n=1 Tax=Streptomyces alfalfae TaxID=1642299 RepID=UPI00281128A8